MSSSTCGANTRISGRTFLAARLLPAVLLIGGLSACGQGNEGAINGDKYASYAETVPDHTILDDEAAMADLGFNEAGPQVVDELQIRVVNYSTAAEEASKCGIFLAEISEWGAINCGRD